MRPLPSRHLSTCQNRPNLLGISRLSFGTGALFLPTSRSCLFLISFRGFSKCLTCTRESKGAKASASSLPNQGRGSSWSIHPYDYHISLGRSVLELTASALCPCFAWANYYKHQTSQASRISLYTFDLGRKVKVHPGKGNYRSVKRLWESRRKYARKARTCTQTEQDLQNSRLVQFFFPSTADERRRVEEQSHLTQATLASMLMDCASAQVLQ